MSAKPTSLQAYKPTSLQAYKPTSLQAYKPCKPLIALLAALALCFCAACSSEDDTPAYCGKWTPTDALISYLNTELGKEMLSTSVLSLAISSNNTVSISVLGGAITIPGTYTYEGNDSSGTFNFTLDYSDINEGIKETAQTIGSTFTDNDITYTTGSLSAVLTEGGNATQIFTK